MYSTYLFIIVNVQVRLWVCVCVYIYSYWFDFLDLVLQNTRAPNAGGQLSCPSAIARDSQSRWIGRDVNRYPTIRAEATMKHDSG